MFPIGFVGYSPNKRPIVFDFYFLIFLYIGVHPSTFKLLGYILNLQGAFIKQVKDVTKYETTLWTIKDLILSAPTYF